MQPSNGRLYSPAAGGLGSARQDLALGLGLIGEAVEAARPVEDGVHIVVGDAGVGEVRKADISACFEELLADLLIELCVLAVLAVWQLTSVLPWSKPSKSMMGRRPRVVGVSLAILGGRRAVLK